MVADNRAQTNRSEPAPGRGPRRDPVLHTRRDVVRRGVKLAFVAPVVSTLFANQAYAANYSCYPLGHACDAASEAKRQQCCGPLTCDGDPGTCQP